MSAKDFYRKHYEIIVVMEGIVEPTGMTIQARSSYLGDEILWGYRFVNVLHYTEGCYQVDFSAFDQVEKADIPSTSAKHQIESSQEPPRTREQRRNSSTRTHSAPNPTVSTDYKRVRPIGDALVQVQHKQAVAGRPKPPSDISTVQMKPMLASSNVCRQNGQLIPKREYYQQRPSSLILNPTHHREIP